MDKKVRFKDLSWPLQVAIIFAWIIGILYIITFISGVIAGYLGI